MTDIGGSLMSVFDYTWQRLHDRLAGLDDDEYFWEPVANSWSLRESADGHWLLDGDGGGGPAPDPAPITTIAWRIGHLGGLALGGFAARRFPDLAADDVDFSIHGSDAVGFMEHNYRRWRQGMESLTDQEWVTPLGPDWGPYADDTSVDLALHVLDELVHHGAEISLLRDLYPHRAELGSPPQS